MAPIDRSRFEAMNDPETRERAARIGRPLEPSDGAEVKRTIAGAPPPELVDRIAALIGVPTRVRTTARTVARGPSRGPCHSRLPRRRALAEMPKNRQQREVLYLFLKVFRGL